MDTTAARFPQRRRVEVAIVGDEVLGDRLPVLAGRCVQGVLNSQLPRPRLSFMLNAIGGRFASSA
jgi:hypothetical protein